MHINCTKEYNNKIHNEPKVFLEWCCKFSAINLLAHHQHSVLLPHRGDWHCFCVYFCKFTSQRASKAQHIKIYVCGMKLHALDLLVFIYVIQKTISNFEYAQLICVRVVVCRHCQINNNHTNNKITNHILFAFNSFLIGILFRLDALQHALTNTHIYTNYEYIFCCCYFESHIHLKRNERKKEKNHFVNVWCGEFFVRIFLSLTAPKNSFVEVNSFFFIVVGKTE